MNEDKIPEGCTCHYERINKKWYVIWSADFEGDKSGRKLVDDKEALYLEMGYQIGKSEANTK